MHAACKTWEAKSVLAIEMVARVCKRELKRKIREKMQLLKFPLGILYFLSSSIPSDSLRFLSVFLPLHPPFFSGRSPVLPSLFLPSLPSSPFHSF
jgi:hypothetical protein